MTSSLQEKGITSRIIIECIHWLIVIGFVIVILLANFIDGRYHSPSMHHLVSLHHTIAFFIFGLIIIRLIWQWVSVPSTAIPAHPLWLHKFTQLMYVLFYVSVVLSVLSQWTIASLSGEGEVTSSFLFFHVKTAVPQVGKLLRFSEGLYSLSISVALILLAIQILLLIYRFLVFLRQHKKAKIEL